MTTHFEDDKLAAYALGELESAERAEIKQSLATDEAARRAVAEFRAAAKLGADALQSAVNPVSLGDERRATIEQAARKNPRSVSPLRRASWRKWTLAVPVAILVGVIGGMIVFRGQSGPVSPFMYMAGGGGGGGPAPEAQMRFNTAAGVSGERRSGGGMGWGMGGYGGPVGGARAAAPIGAPGAPGAEPSGVDRYLLTPGAAQEAAFNYALAAAPEPPKSSEPAPQDTGGAKPQGASSPAEAPIDSLDRYLIKMAVIMIETDDPKAAADQLTAAVTAAGGYVSDLRENTDGLGRKNIQIQVRVPSDKLDTTMGSIDAFGRVIDKAVSTQDVTEEFVDNDARLRNFKKTEERLLDHLSQAILIDSTLKIEQELGRVRGEIERLEGRQRFLGHRIHFSTITVTITERPKAEPILPPRGFSSMQVVSEAIRSLIEFAQTLWIKIIWIGVWAPVWLVVILVAWLAHRIIRRRISGRVS